MIKSLSITIVSLVLLLTSCGQQHEAEALVEDFMDKNMKDEVSINARRFTDIDSTFLLTNDVIQKMRKRFGYRIVKAKWSGKGASQYTITLRVIGNDDIGIVNNLTNIISRDEKLVLRGINIDSHDGLFSGSLVVMLDVWYTVKML